MAALPGLVFAQGNPESDYRFQLDQYRRYYAEYQNYKKDYEARPSLENEQKALLSAKQTIIARELAWANFYLIMGQSLLAPGVTYPLVTKAVTDMNSLASYHFNQASLAEKIVTRSDLTEYTLAEMKVLPTHGLPLTQAQIAIKVAQLIKLSKDAKSANDSLVPALSPVKEEITVQNGLSQIEAYSRQVNEQIETLSKKALELVFETANQPRFLDESSLALAEIRSNLRRLVDVIIDLDTNYVAH